MYKVKNQEIAISEVRRYVSSIYMDGSEYTSLALDLGNWPKHGAWSALPSCSCVNVG